MTPSEFVTLAPSFPARGVVVVSGQDVSAVLALLNLAAAEIEAQTSYVSLVYDARAAIHYTDRQPATSLNQGVLWEYISVSSADVAVVLVANEFDPGDSLTNPNPASLSIDVVRDLFRQTRVPSSHSRLYGTPRELFPFISSVYFYDTTLGEVTFIKNQNPDFPPA